MAIGWDQAGKEEETQHRTQNCGPSHPNRMINIIIAALILACFTASPEAGAVGSQGATARIPTTGGAQVSPASYILIFKVGGNGMLKDGVLQHMERLNSGKSLGGEAPSSCMRSESPTPLKATEMLYGPIYLYVHHSSHHATCLHAEFELSRRVP